MKYTMAVFKSRFATLNFANILKSNHIPSAIINTPPGLKHTCGISVKFLNDFLPMVTTLLSQVNTQYFDGFYAVRQINGRSTLIKL